MPQSPFDEQFLRTLLDHLSDGVYYVDREREIHYWNRGAEQISGYKSGEVVGHRCYDNILGHVDEHGVSLCHTACPLALSMADGEPREATIWLKHHEGFRRPVRVRTAPVKNGAGEVIGGGEIFSDDTAGVAAAREADRARHDALTDQLTGLPNRRMFDAALAGRLENHERYGWDFGLLIADIDQFKEVNDEHGHAVGDAVLMSVATTLQGGTRAGDLLARWGGEEFAVLVEASDASGLREAAQRLRVMVTGSETHHEGATLRVRVSVGGALAISGDTTESLFARADAALYAAKNKGRDRVEIA